MKKTLLFGIIFFVSGIILASFSETFFRKLIQHLYIWLTLNKIQLTGKNFYFPNALHHLSFGITFLIFYLLNKKDTLIINIKRTITSIILFSLSVLIISYLDASIKIIECTACIDGTRYLDYYEIKYSLITSVSLLICLIPNIYRKINVKKPTHNNQYKQ